MKSNSRNYDNPETIRITISLGVIATALGIIAAGSIIEALDTLIPKMSSVLLIIICFSYIMLTGLYYAYPTKNKKDLGLSKPLEWLRQKTYNLSIKIFWSLLFSTLYFIVCGLFGLNDWQSVSLAFVITFCVVVAALIATSIAKTARKKSETANKNKHDVQKT